MLKKSLILIIITTFLRLESQNYSYKKYLTDKERLNNLLFLAKHNKFDSLVSLFPQYENRLDYNYYLLKSLILNFKSDLSQYKFLDTAFMKGLSLNCLKEYSKLFDSTLMAASFKKNFLKLYDSSIINSINEMIPRDQIYREKISEFIQNSQATSNLGSPSAEYKLSKKKNQIIIDSLWQLQEKMDSINLRKFKEILAKYGWPSSNKIGDYYCDGPAPPITLLVGHFGMKNKNFQDSIINLVIDLCKKNKESWAKAEELTDYYYFHFYKKYNLFQFLKVHKHKVEVDSSFFGIYQLVIVARKLSNYKVSIKCKSYKLYINLKNLILNIDNQIKLENNNIEDFISLGIPIPKKISKNRITFSYSPFLVNNHILLKFYKK